ncbi:tyrosine-type recombinase/integrase [Alsobacter sp. SYSU M60028]|uniref:Tyrosine-type recombinase/integrase n=1 Tax=Alsobacter ponti TaxID=2962936 RepID=A0ABT1L7K5_9HYPH|nr:tyrosine-type recombinase/integrase [Alsobacter ponti]MCP8937344.1 tyrosine-type recombinase/integrase [Alsobacter ponti]
MKVEAWPEPDKILWRAALEPVGVFDEGGSRAHHRSRSNAKVEKGYGRWLTYLALASPESLSEAPAARITRERVGAYVQHLESLGNSTQTLQCRLQELGEMAKVMDSDGDWSFISRIAASIRARHVPARDKDAKLVGSDELLDVGLALMDEAATASTPRRRASLYRDGLLIAALALEPLRRRNIAQLELGRSLRQHGDLWFIILDHEDDMKTHTPLECLWPESLAAALQHYLDVHRPYLAGLTGRWSAPVGNALWVSTDGSPLTEMAIYDRVALHTKERFGISVNLHAFRHNAATTLGIERPDEVRAAAPLLGHRDYATTEDYYVRAKRRQAHQQLTEVLEKRRKGSPT